MPIAARHTFATTNGTSATESPDTHERVPVEWLVSRLSDTSQPPGIFLRRERWERDVFLPRVTASTRYTRVYVCTHARLLILHACMRVRASLDRWKRFLDVIGVAFDRWRRDCNLVANRQKRENLKYTEESQSLKDFHWSVDLWSSLQSPLFFFFSFLFGNLFQ